MTSATFPSPIIMVSANHVPLAVRDATPISALNASMDIRLKRPPAPVVLLAALNAPQLAASAALKDTIMLWAHVSNVENFANPASQLGAKFAMLIMLCPLMAPTVLNV